MSSKRLIAAMIGGCLLVSASLTEADSLEFRNDDMEFSGRVSQEKWAQDSSSTEELSALLRVIDQDFVAFQSRTSDDIRYDNRDRDDFDREFDHLKYAN